MSLKIRLSRAGAKKRPYYRIVIADSKSPRDGRYIERVGTYDPLLPKGSTERVKLVEERIKHWLSHGAEPTDRVLRFLDVAGISDFMSLEAEQVVGRALARLGRSDVYVPGAFYGVGVFVMRFLPRAVNRAVFGRIIAGMRRA